MLKTNYSNIILTRGDTAVLTLEIEDYELKTGDTVVLTVKNSIDEEENIFQKTLNNDQFIIDPEDTEDLDYGRYVYDVQLTTATGEVYTVIAPHDFIIGGEVTW